MERFTVPFAVLFGIGFIAGGILGFMTGNPLYIFEVSTVQNTVHIVSGVVALICAAISYYAAKWYLILFGLVYGVVTILGFVNNGDILSLFHVNEADNYLHLGISVITLLVGLSSPSEE